MRIDAHQHFWHYAPRDYSWITGEMQTLKRNFEPEDLKPLLDRAGMDGTIAVQARHAVQETDWLLALADQYPFIKGVVGWVDLESPTVHEQLETYAQRPPFRGVRHIVHDEADDRFMLRPQFLHGLSLLASFDLVYDLLLFPKHLPIAADVVQRFPQQRFVLDHVAKPAIKTHSFAPWDADIRALARFPNVFCKVSGMVTEAAWNTWTPDDFTRYLDTVFDCFGPERLLFGSDWPVCTLSGTYADVVLLVQQYMRGLSVEQQDHIFGGTAAEVYALSKEIL